MKILIEPSTKNNLYQDITTGIFISLDKYAVQSYVYFNLEEIKEIRKNNPNLEIFININKNLSNDDIEPISEILKELVKGTSIIKELFDNKIEYIVLREYGIENIFKELLQDTKEYIDGSCQNNDYVEKYKSLVDNTNFFFKKTIYMVKKNG